MHRRGNKHRVPGFSVEIVIIPSCFSGLRGFHNCFRLSAGGEGRGGFLLGIAGADRGQHRIEDGVNCSIIFVSGFGGWYRNSPYRRNIFLIHVKGKVFCEVRAFLVTAPEGSVVGYYLF